MGGYAGRTCLNHPIQGGAGNILKLTMIKLWNRILNNEKARDKARFLSTVHDEINFSVKSANLNKISKAIQTVMNFSLDEWPIPVITDCSWGRSWGELFGFEWCEETQHYKPKLL
jgi:DNA polymerase I-like protein with 3'-5' exonuclease and polymerase domains